LARSDVLSVQPDSAVVAIAFRARALSSCGRAPDALQLLNDGLVAHPEAADLHIAFDDIAERAIAALCKGPHHVNRVREIEDRPRMVSQGSFKERLAGPHLDLAQGHAR
jgi:hypothetical protein